MLPCRWFQLLLVATVSSVLQTAHAGQRVSSDAVGVSQTEAEEILSAETSFRRYLISCLSNVREKVNRTQGFHIDEIIRGLQLRDVNPLKSLRMDHTSSTLLGETFYNLQGRGHDATMSDWNALMETIPAEEPPKVQLSSKHLLKVQQMEEPFVRFVLRRIQQKDYKPNRRLLGDVLYNHRFKHHPPELFVVLENINQTLTGVPNDLQIRTGTNPDEILSDILQSIPETIELSFILSALSDKGNTVPLNPQQPWELFDLIQEDEHPPDIIKARNTLASAIRYNRIDLSVLWEAVKGHPPVEKLLMVIAQLSFLPEGSPFQRSVRALHPHVKLRWLAAEGQFFRPRTAADVRFLLDSFLTLPEGVDELERIFLDSWDLLESFDFSGYTRPRSLVLGMMEGLLRNSSKLPLCSVIVLKYFLSKHGQFARCRDDFDSSVSLFPPNLAPLIATAVSPQPTASGETSESIYTTNSMLSLVSDVDSSTTIASSPVESEATASVDAETTEETAQTFPVDSALEQQTDSSTQNIADSTTTTEYSTEGLNTNSTASQEEAEGISTTRVETWPTENK